MGKSAIEWTEMVWNPVTGCDKVSAGCKYCYAETMFRRFPDTMGDFNNVTCHPDRLEIPFSWKGSKMVFVNSVSDLFHDDVPFGFIERVFAKMKATPQHTYQILTKRPLRMLSYFQQFYDSYIPPNVWLGVSAENQEKYDERVAILNDVPAAVRWVSAEPLIGPIDRLHLGYNDVDWVVVGGESGATDRRMMPEWVRSIRDQCAMAHRPFFFKQWGAYDEAGRRVGKKAAGALLDGEEYKEFPIVNK